MRLRDPDKTDDLDRLIGELNTIEQRFHGDRVRIDMSRATCRSNINVLIAWRSIERIDVGVRKARRILDRLRSDIVLERRTLQRLRDGVHADVMCWLYALLVTLVTLDVLGLR